MASDKLGISLNLSNIAPTQYSGYNFNSMCKIGDTYLGANSDGIWTLGTSEFDNYVDANTKDNIVAFFELKTTDFGIPNQKRLRFVHCGYEADGSIKLKVKDDEGNERSYTIVAIGGSSVAEGVRTTIGRDGKGRYWGFRIENVSGSYFAVDSSDVTPVILGRKPSGG